MKNILKTIMAVTLIVICQSIFATTAGDTESPAVQFLESNRKAKKLEGAMLRIARPILKKTPMAVVMDNIDMMIICSLEEEDEAFIQNAERALKNYTLAGEINEEDSVMAIYIDEPRGEHFSELILYTRKPDMAIMVFHGHFTIDELKLIGERSEEQRRQRRQAAYDR